MPSVDEKVVGVKFDNADFSRKIAETIGALDRLRASLALPGATKGLADVTSAAGKMDLSAPGHAVEGLSAKFVAMSTIAITALVNITEKALSMAAQVSSSFTIDPITDGFKEYETNMNSIQTILANTQSKGSTLEDVNAALQELNEYSDQTIYNFAEMARNIGTFTAAGVDLDTSVSAIKGIANLAAISGSNATQASTAMYQLSQALSTGTVRLQDWISVEKAGMGGEVFKTALFETGKALGTINDIPMDMTFKEWEEQAGSFRATLTEGEWLTTDVLTTALQAFTGDLSQAQLEQLGYTKEQAREMERLGKLGVASATEVKTITQLIGTVKEAIGTGWADTFRVVIGDFEEAKSVLTAVNTAISDGVARAAQARYEVLRGWADFGGRNAAIEGLVRLFQAVMSVVNPIREAFRELFPRQTTESLLILTDRFRDFATNLKIGGETAEKVKSIFSGVFSVFKIGFAVLKGFGTVVKSIFEALAPAGSGGVDQLVRLGDGLTNLQESLVAGGGIADFFEKVAEKAGAAVTAVHNFFAGIANALGQDVNFDAADAFADGVERVGSVGDKAAGALEQIKVAWEWLMENTEGLRNALSNIGSSISDFFTGLDERIADAMGSTGFNSSLDVLNTGLLGGVLFTVVKLFKSFSDGINVDIGGGIIEKATDALSELGETMKAFQAKLKADALLRIAAAIAMLTISVIALSFVNPEDLTKALTATAVGFGQLIGVFAVLNSSVTGTGAAKITTLSLSLGLIAGALILLAVALKIFGSMEWEEIAKGLTATAGLLAGLAVAVKVMSGNAGGMVRIGLSLIPLAIGLNIMALAVMQFGSMDLNVLYQGLIGIAAALAIIAVVMGKMPLTLVQNSLAMLVLSAALNVLAIAVFAFGSMDLDVLAKGIGAIAIALALIGFTMGLMPLTLPLTAAGLVLVAYALNLMVPPIIALGMLDFDKLKQGILAIAAVLTILAIAMTVMSGQIIGAAAILVVAAALVVITAALIPLAALPLPAILAALGAIAGVFIVFGLAAAILGPLLPVMFGLAAALIVLAAAFALFGVAALSFANAWSIFSKHGKKGTEGFNAMIDAMGESIPRLVAAVINGIVILVTGIIKQIPIIMAAFQAVVLAILSGIRALAGPIAETIGVVILAVIGLLDTVIGPLVEVGFKIIQTILQGIDDNIEEMTNKAVDIFLKFIGVLEERTPELVNAGVDFVLALLQGLEERAEDLVGAALGLLVALVQGLANNIHMIREAATNLIIQFMSGITGSIMLIVQAGGQLLRSLLMGVAMEIYKVVETVTNIIIFFIYALGSNALRIINAGATMLGQLLQGISDNVQKVLDKGKEIVIEFMAGTADAALDIAGAGLAILTKLLDGIGDSIDDALDAGIAIALRILDGLVDKSINFVNKAGNLIITFMSSMRAAIDNKGDAIRRQARLLAGAIINGITGGLAEKAREVADALLDVVQDAWDAAMSWLRAKSPSRRYMKMGGYITDGLKIGINRGGSDVEQASRGLVSRSADGFRNALAVITESLGDITDIQPVIAPVLDLSAVENEARRISGLMATDAIVPTVSFDQARHISHTSDKPTEPAQVIDTTPKELVFNQVINSPTPLTTEDIYRNTKSQIALAKEKLEIP